MRGHHHPIGLILVHAEHRLEHLHDELARRIVVVKQDHFVERRTLSFWCPPSCAVSPAFWSSLNAPASPRAKTLAGRAHSSRSSNRPCLIIQGEPMDGRREAVQSRQISLWNRHRCVALIAPVDGGRHEPGFPRDDSPGEVNICGFPTLPQDRRCRYLGWSEW